MRQTTVTTTLRCDRCKEIVNELKTVYEQPFGTGSQTSDYQVLADLCIPCFQLFGKFMQNPTVQYEGLVVK
jgi:hypothetical protein